MRIKAIENYLDTLLRKTVLRDEIIEVSEERAKELVGKRLAVMLDKPIEKPTVEEKTVEKAPKPKRKKNAE